MGFHKDEYEKTYHSLEPDESIKQVDDAEEAQKPILLGAIAMTEVNIVDAPVDASTTAIDELNITSEATPEIDLAANVGFEGDVITIDGDLGTPNIEESILDHPVDM